jgi:hypothetical protein
MWFWQRPHRHYWVHQIHNKVVEGEKCVSSLNTYQCFSCGSIRYDKVGANGLISSTVTDHLGRTVEKNTNPANATNT